MRSVWYWWAGAFLSYYSERLHQTCEGVRDNCNSCLPDGAAAGISSHFLPFLWVWLQFVWHPVSISSKCWSSIRILSRSAEMIICSGFFFFVCVIFCFSSAAIMKLLKSIPKLCRKMPCLQVLRVSLTMPHRLLLCTTDWLTNQLDYLKIHNHNICFIGNKYLGA